MKGQNQANFCRYWILDCSAVPQRSMEYSSNCYFLQGGDVMNVTLRTNALLNEITSQIHSFAVLTLRSTIDYLWKIG